MSNVPKPVPGRRIVQRLAVGRAVQPWPANTLRYVKNSWRGPLHMQVEGVHFHLRYVATHAHDGTGRYPLHIHPYMELLLTSEGRGTVEWGGGDPLDARPGVLLVMLPQMPHATQWSATKRPWSLFVVDFDLAIDVAQLNMADGDFLDPAFSPFYEWFVVRRQPMLRLRAAEWREARAILQDVSPRLDEKTYGVGSEMLAALLRLMALFSRSLREQRLADGRQILVPKDSRYSALLSARIQMESRVLYDPGNIRRLARAVGYTEEHFIRAFRGAFGVTPKHYAQTMLMRRACGLLQGTDLPVREIASRLGYEDASLLSRAFRRFVGVSPEGFRKTGPPS